MEVSDEKTVLVAPVERSDQIKIGDEVRLVGLDRCADLNDKIAKIVGFHKKSGRWTISLIDDMDAEHIYHVQEMNVRKHVVASAEQVKADAKASLPISLRAPEAPPSKAEIEAHNLAHVGDAPWCEICIDAKGKSDHHASVQADEAAEKQIPQVQMDYMFMTADCLTCAEDKAKATMVTLVDAEPSASSGASSAARATTRCSLHRDSPRRGTSGRGTSARESRGGGRGRGLVAYPGIHRP